jgi:hypothetical protein
MLNINGKIKVVFTRLKHNKTLESPVKIPPCFSTQTLYNYKKIKILIITTDILPSDLKVTNIFSMIEITNKKQMNIKMQMLL